MAEDRAAEDALLFEIAQLDDLAYARQRKDIAKREDIPVSALDQARKTEIARLAAARDEPEEEALWCEEVDLGALLAGLTLALERFLIVEPAAVTAMALWILHAHTHDAWSKSPILLLWGPMPDCGKSTALDVVSRLVPNVLRGAGLSLAYVLRKAPGRTVCFDEIDKEFRKKGQDIEGWLTLGSQRGRVFGRAVPDDPLKTVDYDPWCPKCIAMIGRPWDEQVLSRCLPIEMKRKLEGEEVEEYVDTETYPELDVLRQKAARWAQDHIDELRTARPERPEGLRGTRPYDNWRPLLAIADLAGAEWARDAREAAVHLQPKNEMDRTMEMLADLRSILESGERDFWPSADLVERLLDMEHREYETLNRGKPITQKWLATRLNPFKVEPGQPTIDGRKSPVRGYLVSQFEDTFARYLSSSAPATDRSDQSDQPGADRSRSSDGQELAPWDSPEPQDELLESEHPF